MYLRAVNTWQKSIIRSITVLTLSLNNIHVGAKLNGEQHLIKFIQSASEKKKKTSFTVLCSPYYKIRPATLVRHAPGPLAQHLTARQPKRPGIVRLPRPIGMDSAHQQLGCRRPSDTIRQPSGLSARSKTRRPLWNPS